MKKSVLQLIFIASFVTGCGGGGGGGGSPAPQAPSSGSSSGGSSSGSGNSGSNTQTVTYRKMTEIYSGKFDTLAAFWATRDNSKVCFDTNAEFSFEVNDANGDQKTWALGPQNYSGDLEPCDSDWFVSAYKTGDSNPYFTFGSNLVFADYAYHSNALIDFPNNDQTLEKIEAELKNLIPIRTSESADWFGSEYVLPYLIWLEFGEEDAISAFTDRDHSEDVVAFVAGDRTVTSQTPNSGTHSYSIKAVGFYAHEDFRNAPEDYLGNSPYALDRRYVVATGGQITVDLDGSTTTGDLNFGYVFPESYDFPQIWKREYDLDGGGITFSQSGTSKALIWSGSNNGDGKFNYEFFGPNGDSIGGVGVVKDENFNRHIVFAFVGSKS